MKSKNLELTISERGAEIQSLKYNGKEIMKDSNEIWGYTSPYLFPTIGRSKNGIVNLGGIDHAMPGHGVVRNEKFQCVYKKDNEEIWEFFDNDTTYEPYPYHFSFQVRYILADTKLNVEIKVTNLSNTDMPFQLGLHPAFKIHGLENYKVEFETPETLDTPTVTEKGQLDFSIPTNQYHDLKELTFKYSDFDIDTIIMRHLKSRSVLFSSKEDSYKIKFDFPDFMNFSIWTNGVKKAPFLCLEPWNGHSDLVDSDTILAHRPDVNILKPDEEKVFRFSFEFIEKN